MIRTKLRKKTVVEKRITDLGLEVFLPWLRSRRRVGTRYQWVVSPLFPGYLFCRLDILLLGKAVRYAPGVRDFVKFGSRIAEVGEGVIKEIRDRCPGGVAEIKPRPYRPGEPVMIREGPFAGLEAMFEREMMGSERNSYFARTSGTSDSPGSFQRDDCSRLIGTGPLVNSQPVDGQQ